jgi:hypothetical protein
MAKHMTSKPKHKAHRTGPEGRPNRDDPSAKVTPESVARGVAAAVVEQVAAAFEPGE